MEALLAEVAEGEVELAGGVFLHPRRDADAARLGQRFEARRDIDAITEDVAVLGDNVALVYADAEHDAVAGCDRGVAFGHYRLDLCGTAQRVDRTAEFDQQAVAGRLDDPATMRLDGWIDDLRPDGPQPLQCARLVGAD